MKLHIFFFHFTQKQLVCNETHSTEWSPPVSLPRDLSLNWSWRLASNSYASSSLLLEKHSQFQIRLFFTPTCKQPFPYFTTVLQTKLQTNFFVFVFPSLLLHFLDWKFHSFPPSEVIICCILEDCYCMDNIWLMPDFLALQTAAEVACLFTRLSTPCTGVPNGTLIFLSQ